MKNPFEFKYPDDISAQDVIDLFVPVFGEYYNIPVSGHTFINGARGSGKSMMFRFMKPDCQVLVNQDGQKLELPRKISELDYFGIYIPIKKGQLNIMDIMLNDKHGMALLTEHFMVTHFSITIFNEINETDFSQGGVINDLELLNFYNDEFIPLLEYSGYNLDISAFQPVDAGHVFATIIKILKNILKDFQHDYLKKLIGATGSIPYDGPILLYSEFLYKLLKELRRLSFMPLKPIYLLIDDADELSVVQRRVLNSWVALRTTEEVSLKISTQLKYKIYTTINNSRIDTPHDYAEININDIYTSKKDIYYQRVREIVSKRLKKFNFPIEDPELFYPQDQKQKIKIESKWAQYVQDKIKEGLNSDQAYAFAHRYVVPDYIKNDLKGNRYTYSYSGFKQLVNISSGIVREFINFSSEMYTAQQSKNDSKIVSYIESSVQDREIKKYSQNKIDTEIDKFRDEAKDKTEMDKLRNLVHGMGGLFGVILLSNTSERRVFSVALNDEPDDELRGVLDLGVQNGYLQKSMIGNKHGTGKSRLYILTRMLAPHFKLDPTSFAGYKFMDSSTLKVSLSQPERFISGFKRELGVSSDMTETGKLDF